jgi:hypothetical protein
VNRGSEVVLTLGMAMTVAARAAAAAQAAPTGGRQPGLELTLRVYNYAPAPHTVLGESERQLKSVFTRGGISTVWLDCFADPKGSGQASACSQPAGPTDVVVRLLNRSMSNRLTVEGEPLGFAMPYSREELLNVVNILYDHIEQAAGNGGASAGQILGVAIAHEIGHLLLGPKAHAVAGIMRAQWGVEDLALASRGCLFFGRQEAKHIRAEMLLRGKRKELRNQRGLGITVRVHNFAGVPGDTLSKAEEMATIILRTAGAQLLWVGCPLDAADAPDYSACQEPLGLRGLDLSIVPIAPSDTPEHTLGLTPMTVEGERASLADIFYNRVTEQADATRQSLSLTLGHAVAHEIGHVLLRTSLHSSNGIMRAEWTAEDLLLAAQGQLLFTPEESERIRAETLFRTAQQESGRVQRVLAKECAVK